VNDDVGMLPFYGYQLGENGEKRPITNDLPIVSEPFGPDVTVPQGMGQIVFSIGLRGNAFCIVVARDRLEFPTQLRVLHPDWVRVDLKNGRKTFRVGMNEVDAADIIHIPGRMLPGAVVGIDPISYYRATLGISFDLQSYAGAFFRNGTSLSGVLTTDQDIDDAQAKTLEGRWSARNAGIAHAHKVAVLGNGAKFQSISVTPEQAQFLASRQFQREEICGWMGVPLDRIMAIVEKSSQGGGKGADTREQGYVTHTLVARYLARIESVWNRMIPGGLKTFARFNTKELLRASALERSQIHSAGRAGGWLSKNDVRADEDLPRITTPDGDDYMAPLNSAVSDTSPDNGAPGEDENEGGATQ
ncbi:MAG TPA: phage portal protein, partial [Acidothermaceae bacterium]|nr:phage portal protein [Acidothermaceae bacterium]